MVEEKIYRAGAIGRTGGGNYGHGIHLGYKGHERIEFVSVADPDEEGRQRAEAETGAKRTYADYQEMLERESLDLVSVCPRWVDCHLEMVLACVEAGCHVYCEKPMAMRLDDADRMVSAADRRGVRIAVAHQGVYLPQTREAKRLVESGRIGDPPYSLCLGQTGPSRGWRRHDGAWDAPLQHDALFLLGGGLDVRTRDG